MVYNTPASDGTASGTKLMLSLTKAAGGNGYVGFNEPEQRGAEWAG